MDKKLLTIISILISLVFISGLIMLFSIINKEVKNTANEAVSLNNQIEMSEFEPYNHKIVSGDTVVATINKFRRSRAGVDMSYAICKTSTASSTSSNWSFYGVHKMKYFGSSSTDSSYSIQSYYTDSIIGYISTNTTLTSYTTIGNSVIKPTDKYLAEVAMYRGIPIGVVFFKQ